MYQEQIRDVAVKEVRGLIKVGVKHEIMVK